MLVTGRPQRGAQAGIAAPATTTPAPPWPLRRQGSDSRGPRRSCRRRSACLLHPLRERASDGRPDLNHDAFRLSLQLVKRVPKSSAALASASLITMPSRVPWLSRIHVAEHRTSACRTPKDANTRSDDFGDSLDQLKAQAKGVMVQVGAAIAARSRSGWRRPSDRRDTIAWVRENRNLVVVAAKVAAGVVVAGLQSPAWAPRCGRPVPALGVLAPAIGLLVSRSVL